MATKRPNIEVFNQGNQQATFGHLPNQTLTASNVNGHHSLTSSGVGANLLIGGPGTNVFAFKSTTTWPGYASQNVGDPENAGPNTLFGLAGYAQNTDVYHGYAGATNIIWMANGDKALFLDDGFSPGVDSLRFTNITSIECGTGKQIIDLTSSRYAMGNVTIKGGIGDDVLMASSGDDTIYAGKGNDYVWGGSGNDTLVYEATKAAGFIDTFIGASGVDTLKIKLTAAQNTAAVQAELKAFHDFIADASHNGQSFQFHSLGNLTATSIERLDVSVDNVHVNIGTSAAKMTLEGGGASHVLTGGTGGDTFFWKATDIVGHTGGPDHVANFSFEQLDRIDLSRLVGNHMPANIEDVVHVVETAAGSLVQAHLMNDTAWTDIVVLDNVHNVSAANLYQSHSLIL